MTEEENFSFNSSQFSLPSLEDSTISFSTPSFSSDQFTFSLPEGDDVINTIPTFTPFEVNDMAQPSILSMSAGDNKMFPVSSSPGTGSIGHNLFFSSNDMSDNSSRGKSSPSNIFLAQVLNDENEEEIDVDGSLKKQREELEKIEKINQKYQENKSVILKDPNFDSLNKFELIINNENSSVKVTEPVNKEFPKTIDRIQGFICSKNKVGIFFANFEKYLLTFFAKDFKRKFECFDFAELPCARKGFSIFNISDTKVGILGGNGAVNGSDFWIYQHSPIPKWSNVKIIGTNLPVISYHSSAVVENDNMSFIFTFGGRRYNDITNSLLLFIYQNGFCTFRDFKMNYKNIPNPRIKHTFTLYNNAIYLFGGMSENGCLLNDFWRLNISINGLLNPVWEPISIETPSPRYGHHAFCRDNCLYIAGGFDSEGVQINDVWKYDGTKWSLVSSFDSSKYIFTSDFGLVSFSETFELEPELPSNEYLNSLYNTLLEKRKEYIDQYIDFKKKILYEKEQKQIIQRLSDILKDKSQIQNYRKMIRSVFHHKEEIPVLRENFIQKANELLTSYKGVNDEKQKSQQDKDLLKELSSKLKVDKKKSESEISLHASELSVLQKQIEMLKKQEQLPQPEPIDFEFKKSFKDAINKTNKEVQNKDFLSHYYYTSQFSLYESNKRMITELKAEIENTKNQYIRKNQEFSELFNELYSSKEIFEKIQKRKQQYNSLLKEIEPQRKYLSDYNKSLIEYKNSEEEFQKNLDEITKENKQKQAQLIGTIEDVTNKKYPLEALFLIVNDIKNYYKNSTMEEATTHFHSVMPQLKEINAAIFQTQTTQ